MWAMHGSAWLPENLSSTDFYVTRPAQPRGTPGHSGQRPAALLDLAFLRMHGSASLAQKVLSGSNFCWALPLAGRPALVVYCRVGGAPAEVAAGLQRSARVFAVRLFGCAS